MTSLAYARFRATVAQDEGIELTEGVEPTLRCVRCGALGTIVGLGACCKVRQLDADWPLRDLLHRSGGYRRRLVAHHNGAFTRPSDSSGDA